MRQEYEATSRSKIAFFMKLPHAFLNAVTISLYLLPFPVDYREPSIRNASNSEPMGRVLQTTARFALKNSRCERRASCFCLKTSRLVSAGNRELRVRAAQPDVSLARGNPQPRPVHVGDGWRQREAGEGQQHFLLRKEQAQRLALYWSATVPTRLGSRPFFSVADRHVFEMTEKNK